MLSNQTYLIFAVNRDQVGLYFGLQSLWEGLIVRRSLKKRERLVDEQRSQLVVMLGWIVAGIRTRRFTLCILVGFEFFFGGFF